MTSLIPVFAIAGGDLLLDEALTLQVFVGGGSILDGAALADVVGRKQAVSDGEASKDRNVAIEAAL